MLIDSVHKDSEEEIGSVKFDKEIINMLPTQFT